MASVQKFTDAAVTNQLRHNAREIINSTNKDIDKSRTHLNYSLTPERPMSPKEYYISRKKELYVYGRKDVKTMAGWVITAPKELSDTQEELAFFRSTYNFLEHRYGKENVIQATVHYDEGKMEKVIDRWGKPLKDKNGKPIYKLIIGRPHLHFDFIPVVADNNPKHIQGEKICANDVLNRHELQHFHSDLQQHLKKDGIDCSVITGITKSNGRNYTVQELKERYEIKKELDRLHNLEHKYTNEHERSRW